jgi:hypothetical protein
MMPNWSSLTLAQLRAATKAEIITAIDNWLANHTKRQIIELLLDVTNIADRPDISYGADGQIARRDVVFRDVVGNVTGGRRMNYSYYPSGEIDTIKIIDVAADLATVLRRRTVKHYLDGRQPEQV